MALPDTGPWTLCGIYDLELAQIAHQLTNGQMQQIGEPGTENIAIEIVPIKAIAERGPLGRDINGIDRSQRTPRQRPRGPFDVLRPFSAIPTYPILWAHSTQKERMLFVEPDREGQIRSWTEDQDWINEKAARVWKSAARTHFNLDCQFNANSLNVAMTERKSLGGRAWPSLKFDNQNHEYAFSLWCNSTLGLLLRWWMSNKTQAGRGSIPVTAIPHVPTLDLRTLSPEQHLEAEKAFLR